ncbi:hypothetical protein B0H14DRAFT_2739235 [Mycena olivaceomarginata]|nr:hypothetical protein B0H14DRAFT_2739235 [Mycena olivaceomarginata]
MSDSEENTVLGKRTRKDDPDADTNSKQPRPNDPVDEDDSDDEQGPMPLPAAEAVKKKEKAYRNSFPVLPHEKLYLEHLPNTEQYYKSFMHLDVINFCVVTKTDFLITTSIDGHLKLWKKQESGIESVKRYRAHLTPVVAVSASADGQLFATVSVDRTAKVFDVVNFDMINIIQLGYTPHCCCWVHRRGQAQGLLAVSEEGTGVIRLYDGRGDDKPLETIENLHRFPVHLMTYSDRYDTVISADEGGFVEYWQPTEPFVLPKMSRGLWSYKSETDLYEFKKSKSTPTCITLSPRLVVVFRVFSFLAGKLTRKYDESLQAIQEMQQAGTAMSKLDDMEFGRRLAMERELEMPGPDGHVPGRWSNAIWDESGAFILYPSLLGVKSKVVNTVTNRVVRLLGKDEPVRWMKPQSKGVTTMAMAASANPILANKGARDPTLFCTGYKKQRFYLFTRSEPEDNIDRDVFNERPTREDQNVATNTIAAGGPSPLANSATIHTTMGDMHMRLFPAQAPKAVENFVGHARSGFFEGIVFHRVIPKFMIQTGDPLGDGTGGSSIWGREFEDEFSDELRHDRPYTFFITTTTTPWLDNKHTIFGRVISGLEVVHEIENVKTSNADKPYEDIKIVNVSIAN